MNKRVALGAVAIAAVLGIGSAWWISERASPGSAASNPASASTAPKKGEVINGVVQDGSGKQVLYWHDPMVPGHKFNEPGKSPFMDMQLVPQYAGDEADGGVRVPSTVMQNLGVRTGKAKVTVRKDPLTAVGRVAFDEHQVEAIQTRTAGFVERLYVRAEGDPVKAGQKIADVYSPDLLAAQHELVALSRVANVPDIDALRAAARERLRLLGMSNTEIQAVENSATPRPRVGVYAPTAGVVRELGVREGAQVMPGQTIVQLAGLQRVWVLAELTESESGRVHADQSARISVDALPGKTFDGKVEYVYPQLDTTSRTVPVRIEMPNDKGLLRPGMYAQVELATEQREALTVPSEAVIITGVRKVVLVREDDRFLPVEVRTASESGGRTEILAGLRAGDEVVLSGQFLIDSEASLKGVLARLAAGEETAGGASSEQRQPSGQGMAEGGDAKQATAKGQGTVTEVAPAQGTVTISHGPISALNWPEMTMGFKLRDPSVVQGLKPGTRVAFELKTQPEAGEYVIESITPVSGGEGANR